LSSLSETDLIDYTEFRLKPEEKILAAVAGAFIVYIQRRLCLEKFPKLNMLAEIYRREIVAEM
jgi:hypothetical protein